MVKLKDKWFIMNLTMSRVIVLNSIYQNIFVVVLLHLFPKSESCDKKKWEN